MSNPSKSVAMAVTQVIELLKQGNLKALSEVPADIIQAATAQMSASTTRNVGVTVYPKSGSIGITGIRMSPICGYKDEWRRIKAVLASDEFAKALENPLASTGSDDPRYAQFRATAKAKRKADTEARSVK